MTIIATTAEGIATAVVIESGVDTTLTTTDDVGMAEKGKGIETIDVDIVTVVEMETINNISRRAMGVVVAVIGNDLCHMGRLDRHQNLSGQVRGRRPALRVGPVNVNGRKHQRNVLHSKRICKNRIGRSARRARQSF